MLPSFLKPRDNASAINAVAIAQHSDPMQNHARILGAELKREELERKYEYTVLALAALVAVNIGILVWFWLDQESVCLILDHGLAH
jgi:hypothetical protein